jgi:hypothetical protein
MYLERSLDLGKSMYRGIFDERGTDCRGTRMAEGVDLLM